MVQRVQPAVTTVGHDAGEGLRVVPAVLEMGELAAWIALRRVNEGGVAMLDGAFYHHGRAVPCYLNTPLAELVKTGWLSLTEAEPNAAGMRQVMFTENGREWYEVLCGKRGVSSDSPIDALRGNAAPVPSGVIGLSARRVLAASLTVPHVRYCRYCTEWTAR